MDLVGAAGVVSNIQAISPFFWFTHGVGEFKVADPVHMSVQHWNSALFGASKGLVHDGPGVDSAALRRSPEEEEAFCSLTYMLVPYFYSLKPVSSLYNAILEGWEVLRCTK